MENATQKFTFITGMFDGYTTDYLNQEREQMASSRGRRYISPILAGPISLAPGVLNAMAVAAAQQEMVLNRTKRIVISGPILIATAIGTAAIAIAAGTAHVIATNEANKVLKE